MKNYCCNKHCFLAFCLLFGLQAQAQILNSLMSGPAEPYIVYESNYSKIMSRQVQISGYGLGLEWESGLSLGLTYYNLSSKVFSPKYSTIQGADWLLHMQYISIVTTYSLLEKQKFAIRGELGNGLGRISFTDNNVKKSKFGLYCFEPAANFRYNILEWLGLVSQVGYRLAIPGGAPTIRDFSSFKFNIGFTVSPTTFYESLKNNTLFN